MSFFSRILNFSPEGVRRHEQRRSQRYPVGSGFALAGGLLVPGGHGNGQPDTAYPAKVVDLSAIGVSVRLTHPLRLERGAVCHLHLSLEHEQVAVVCSLANLRTDHGKIICGLELVFPDFPTQKDYLQLVEAVALGAMLRPVDARFLTQEDPAQKKEKYTGETGAELTVWRAAAGGGISGFELRMNDYFVRGHGTAPLEIYSEERTLDGHRAGYDTPALDRLSSDAEEIRRLFRWVVPNFPASLPSDIPEFLHRFTR